MGIEEGNSGGGREGRTLPAGPMYMLMASNQLFTEDGILPGLGKKTQKQREDAFLRLLSNFAVEQQQHNLPERVDLMAFFDLLDERNVQVEDKEVDDLCGFADSQGHIDQSRLLDYSRSSNYWQILIKKDVYADPEVLKLMTKTYDLSGREKGPPKISKLDTINKQINKVSSAFAALDKDKDGLVTKKDFERSFTTLSPVQVEACFKKFDKDKDGMLNFVEFKNFMGKRKSLPDKALARCTSTLSLRSAGSAPPSYSSLSVAIPP